MLNIFFFLGSLFFFTFVIGKALEKIRVPWIFAALLIGTFLSIFDDYLLIPETMPSLSLLSELGMYFLLFMIGFEIDLDKLKKIKGFIFQSTAVIILLEGIFGSVLIHFLFGYDWFISGLIALSFASVGEAILIPILDEFKMVNTRLGQSIIGIGTLDDVVEIFLLMVVAFMIGSESGHSTMSTIMVIASIFFLFALSFGLTELRKEGNRFNIIDVEMMFLFVLAIFFLFIGIGLVSHLEAIAALLAGVSLKAFIPNQRYKNVEKEIKAMCYGFFAPIFFVDIGLSIEWNVLLSAPVIVLAIVFISAATKILGSYLMAAKELGKKEALLLGIGLSVRFSTGIIIAKILFEHGVIDELLYSAIIASSIIFSFLVPLMFSYFIVHWDITRSRQHRKMTPGEALVVRES